MEGTWPCQNDLVIGNNLREEETGRQEDMKILTEMTNLQLVILQDKSDGGDDDFRLTQ